LVNWLFGYLVNEDQARGIPRRYGEHESPQLQSRRSVRCSKVGINQITKLPNNQIP